MNTPCYAEDVAGGTLSFVIPSAGRIRFSFANCAAPENVSVPNFAKELYGDVHPFAVSWKTGIESRCSNWFALQAGRYYIKLSGGAVNPEAKFTVDFEAEGSYAGESGPNDSFDTAVELKKNTPYWGGQYLDYDNDYYHFSLTRPSRVSISAVNSWYGTGSPDSVVFYREDSRGNTKRLGSLRCPQTMRLEAGSYYVVIEGEWGSAVPEYTLTVNITAESASKYEQERNNLRSQANTKQTNRNYTGNINQYGAGSEEGADTDWYKFSVKDKSYLKLELTVPRQAQGSVTAVLYKGSKSFSACEAAATRMRNLRSSFSQRALTMCACLTAVPVRRTGITRSVFRRESLSM